MGAGQKAAAVRRLRIGGWLQDGVGATAGHIAVTRGGLLAGAAEATQGLCCVALSAVLAISAGNQLSRRIGLYSLLLLLLL